MREADELNEIDSDLKFHYEANWVEPSEEVKALFHVVDLLRRSFARIEALEAEVRSLRSELGG